MTKTVLQYIDTMIELEKKGGKITMEEWCDIRRNGTPEEIEEAVERMETAGGYDNLE